MSSIPAPMNWIARTYIDQGEYDSARIWYQTSIDASAVSDQEEVGLAWHGLATIDFKKGDYHAAREELEKAMKIRQKIGDLNGEASTWHALASIDLEKGDCEAAREKFGKAMNISQQIDDRAGEASTWHDLASIDMDKGNYEAAQENFEKALKIRQQIGDKAAEAATIYQLGFLAWELGRSQEGLRLVALACIMLSSIGHANAKKGFEGLSGMASKLKYTQEQIDALLKEVSEAYQKDRGQGLIDAAFPKG